MCPLELPAEAVGVFPLQVVQSTVGFGAEWLTAPKDWAFHN